MKRYHPVYWLIQFSLFFLPFCLNAQQNCLSFSLENFEFESPCLYTFNGYLMDLDYGYWEINGGNMYCETDIPREPFIVSNASITGQFVLPGGTILIEDLEGVQTLSIQLYSQGQLVISNSFGSALSYTNTTSLVVDSIALRDFEIGIFEGSWQSLNRKIQFTIQNENCNAPRNCDSFNNIIALEPSNPTECFSIQANVSGELFSGCCSATGFTQNILGNSIEIDISTQSSESEICPTFHPPWSFPVEIGTLGAGNYTIILKVNGTIVATKPFTVNSADCNSGSTNNQIVIDPVNPSECQSVTASISGEFPNSCWAISDISFALSGNTIDIYASTQLEGDACLQVITPWNIIVGLGMLEEGNYDANLHIDGGIASTIPFSVSAQDCSTGSTNNQIIINPTIPIECQNTQVTASGEFPNSCWAVTFYKSVIIGNTIEIQVTAESFGEVCLQVLTPWSITTDLGVLSATNYNVLLKVNNEILTTYPLLINPVHSDLEVTSTLDNDTTLISNSTITSTSTVYNGARVVFQAGSSITLSPGFSVMAGSEFQANINLTCAEPEAKLRDPAIAIAPKPKKMISFKCYPNPASSHLNISYTLPYPSKIRASLLNLNGQEVKKILSTANLDAGQYNSSMTNLENLPTGSYIVMLQVDKEVLAKRVFISHK